MFRCFPGAARRPGCTIRRPVSWSAAACRWPRCTHAASRHTTPRTSGTPPPTPPGTCWSAPGSTRCPRSPTPALARAPAAPTPARYIVIYVQNVTDVDDPLLERAARDGEDWRELARREIQRYRADMEALRILPPTHLVGAVEALPVIERFTARLADRGAVYDVDEDLYFAKSADPEFGALSGPGNSLRLRPCGDGRAFRRARRQRPGGRGRRTRWMPWSGAPNGRASRPGTRGSAGAAPAGTSSAPPSPPSTSARSSTCKPHPDLVFPHHELSASHARVAFAPAEGVFARYTPTPGWSATKVTRCPSRWATWSS